MMPAARGPRNGRDFGFKKKGRQPPFNVPDGAVSYSSSRMTVVVTEVEEDAPGRDAGRFADDLNHWLNEAHAGYRLGNLEADWIARDLTSLGQYLQSRARTCRAFGGPAGSGPGFPPHPVWPRLLPSPVRP
jgi:hypothetical protein